MTSIPDPVKFSNGPTGRVIKASSARAWLEGYNLLQSAKAAAEEQQAASRKAYGDSYAQGYEDGYSEGRTAATRLIQTTTARVDRYLGSLENEITSLALDIVTRVLGAFDTGNLLAQAARQALVDLRRSKYVKIAVNPAMEQAVRRELADLMANEEIPFEIHGDPELAADACILSSDLAVIDATLKVQLEAIRTNLQTADATFSRTGHE
ncbi:HrpE/YscL family type III secretion apparatus protein [Ochrobactrum sp. POC9]|uniref:type III secretion system stator protein SctL n=1 Tax=unclassified Ochrobactrum TaxID=239106 RepID=UPI000D707C4F|nr:type III secretion system stator protein SctL [Ochrobactrum sp. POC9]MCH4542818.1 type III secretion system stator protein SctL [Ochrobactrum sp. A-1]PWU71067.1 HrpE/YscL family type III secretion apparatus protein [Ochrobactrum sp. POC9]